jgi:hypothetical protein
MLRKYNDIGCLVDVSEERVASIFRVEKYRNEKCVRRLLTD